MAPDWLAARAHATPNGLAVDAPDARWTYAELDARASRMAARLEAAGVGRASHVAVVLPCGAEYVATVHAVWRLDAVLVPLDPRFPAAERERRLEKADATHLVTEEGVRALDRPAPRGRKGLRALVFTSGTSGDPKAVMLTAPNLLASGGQANHHLRLTAKDAWLAAVPLFHVGGLAVLVRVVQVGAAVVVQPRFDPAAMNRALDEGRATVASLVPVMLQRMLDEREDRPFPESVRALVLGGDATPRPLLERASRIGAPVLTTYGMSETGSMIACQAPGDPEHPPGSPGRPLPLSQARIEGDEIVVAGPMVSPGYYGDPEATAEAFRGGAFHTGDAGRIDEHGYLWVEGRVTDRIITGGENVDPREVEDVLRAHPTVGDACVVGVPDPEWGERVAAAVVLAHEASSEDLEAHCRERLAGFKLPRRWAFLEAIPRTESGKPLRREVAARLRD